MNIYIKTFQRQRDTKDFHLSRLVVAADLHDDLRAQLVHHDPEVGESDAQRRLGCHELGAGGCEILHTDVNLVFELLTLHPGHVGVATLS